LQPTYDTGSVVCTCALMSRVKVDSREDYKVN